MNDSKNYYLGLDMGTSSVGWAVSDENYHLLRAKGKDLWGVRLFETAESSADRRMHRIARRRRQREKVRIGFLKEFFADEIEKIDPGFYQRCEESKFLNTDRSTNNQQPYALFANKDYTDANYYRQYKTIFHLRAELLHSKEPHDVRLVYLAVLNIFKHRGHFLNSGDFDLSDDSISDLWKKTVSQAKNLNILLPELSDSSPLEQILMNRSLSRTKKSEEVAAFLQISKKEKQSTELLKLLCGMSAKCSILFENETCSEDFLKKNLSFRDVNYEDIANEAELQISKDFWELIETIKDIHDISLLSDIRKGCTYLSEARVQDYEKHETDLQCLKALVKEYLPDKYNNFFRKMDTDNYSAYVGTVNSKIEKIRRNGSVLSRDDFYKSVKKLLQKISKTDEFLLINQSPSGLFQSVIDLKTV